MYKNVALAPKKRDIFMLRYQNYTGGFKQSNLPTTRLMGDCAIFSPLMRFIDSFLRIWYRSIHVTADFLCNIVLKCYTIDR